MFYDQVSAIVIIMIETRMNSLKNRIGFFLFRSEKVAETQLVPLSSRFLNFHLFCSKRTIVTEYRIWEDKWSSRPHICASFGPAVMWPLSYCRKILWCITLHYSYDVSMVNLPSRIRNRNPFASSTKENAIKKYNGKYRYHPIWQWNCTQPHKITSLLNSLGHINARVRTLCSFSIKMQ